MVFCKTWSSNPSPSSVRNESLQHSKWLWYSMKNGALNSSPTPFEIRALSTLSMVLSEKWSSKLKIMVFFEKWLVIMILCETWCSKLNIIAFFWKSSMIMVFCNKSFSNSTQSMIMMRNSTYPSLRNNQSSSKLKIVNNYDMKLSSKLHPPFLNFLNTVNDYDILWEMIL